MRIDGLNQEQIELLDKIWQCETREDLSDFVSGLPIRKRPLAKTLITLIELEMLDDHVNSMERFPLAEKVLEKY